MREGVEEAGRRIDADRTRLSRMTTFWQFLDAHPWFVTVWICIFAIALISIAEALANWGRK
jgi:hypothetical protein